MRTDSTLLNSPRRDPAGVHLPKTAKTEFTSAFAAAQGPKTHRSIRGLTQTDLEVSEGRLNGIDTKPLEELAAGATHYWRHEGKAIEPTLVVEAVLPPAIGSLFVPHTPTEVTVEPQATPAQLEQTLASAAVVALGHLNSAAYLETFFNQHVTKSTTY